MYVIYGKIGCAQCEMAKNILTAKDKGFIYKQLDVDFSKTELLSITPVTPRSFPVIFEIKGNDMVFVGGITELKNSFSTVQAVV